MITAKSSVFKQHFPAPKVLNPCEANPTFMLQPKPLDGAVKNSVRSSSSESCLVFRKSALILFLRHFQWERSCKQRGRFLSVYNICTEFLLSREQTQGHPTRMDTLRDDWSTLQNMSKQHWEHTNTHQHPHTDFISREEKLSWILNRISIQKDKQNRTRSTQGAEKRGNGGKDT